MTNGLVNGRRTMFFKGYAVQWYEDVFGRVKAMLYVNVPNNKYVFLTDFACASDVRYVVEETTIKKIKEIEGR